MRRRITLIGLGAVGLLSTAAAWARTGDLGPVDGWRARRAGGHAFTPAAWRAADAVERGRMVADLAARHRLVGRTRDSVVALLGPGECYRRYDDEPCYSLMLDGRRVKLAFAVNHSDAPGRVVSMALER